MLKAGGYLLIEDTQLHSVKEMVRFLMEQPGFSLVLDLQKSLVIKKLPGERDFGEWTGQPYMVRRSDQYLRSPNMFSLHDDTMFTTAYVFFRHSMEGLRPPLYWVGRRLPPPLRQRLKRAVVRYRH